MTTTINYTKWITAFVVFFLVSAVNAQTNTPPVADAGPDLVDQVEGNVIPIDGSNSSDLEDGVPTTYSWVQLAGPAATFFDASSAVAVAQLPFVGGTGATLTFELTVTDSGGLTATDTVDVIIKKINTAPTANAGPDVPAVEGANVILDGSGSFDPELDTLTYLWEQTMGTPVVINNSNMEIANFDAPITGSGDVLEFRLIVFDGEFQSQDLVTVTVTTTNNPPVASVNGPLTAAFEEVVTLDGSGSSDPDNDTLTYNWTQTAGTPVVLDFTNPAQPTFVAPSVYETLTFSLVVNDGTDNSPAVTVDVNVTPPGAIPNCADAYVHKKAYKKLRKNNHKLKRVRILGLNAKKIKHNYDSDDEDSDSVSNEAAVQIGKNFITIDSVFQDEPVLISGFNGDSAPDAAVSTKVKVRNGMTLEKDKLRLRSEHDPAGNGRVYVVNFTATNSFSGATCTGTVEFCSPNGKNSKTCVNDGATEPSL